MASTWSEQSAVYLTATDECPRCRAVLAAAVCANCGADLRGPEAIAVMQASQAAAAALRERERLISALPTAPAAAGAAPAVPAAVPAVPAVAVTPAAVVAPQVGGPPAWVASVDASAIAGSGAAPARAAEPAAPVIAPAAPVTPPVAPAASAPRPESQTSVQSVLAVAGAALFAVAAIVFTFLNPEITQVVRTLVTVGVTIAFFVVAWVLRSRGVVFSGEAIGALGMVFLALDVQALAEVAPAGVSGWVFAALGTFVASAIMLAVSLATRMRTWFWSALVGLVLTPAFLGYAGAEFAVAWGHVVAGAVALVANLLAPRAAGRFGGSIRTERATMTVLQLLSIALVLVQLPFLGNTPERELGRVLLLVALGACALIAVGTGARRFWSAAGGVLCASAVAITPLLLGLPSEHSMWLLTLIPVAAAVALAVTSFVPAAGGLLAQPLRGGALGVLLLSASFGAYLLTLVLARVGVLFVGSLPEPGRGEERRFGSELFTEDASTWALAALMGVAASAVGVGVLAWRTRRDRLAGVGTWTGTGLAALALWLAGAAVLQFVAWPALSIVAQVGLGIGVSVLASLAVVVPASPIARAPLPVRAPFITAAHLALFVAALLSWADAAVTVPLGAVIVAAMLLVSRTVPAPVRAVHVGVAYAYALVLLATALVRGGVDTVAVLCLTTTTAALVALAATLVRRLDARSWYAILVVTLVPFLVGIATVLLERSAWTALSTAVIAALAVALVFTRRPGLNRFVRGAAAAMIVPALSVVVICLGAATLDSSGSPVALPIVAVLVAVALPLTSLLERAMLRSGITAADAAVARLWFEVGALVSAAVAVLLSILRDAAGLGTAAVVLVIIGLGAAAMRVVAGRRYGWWLAAAAWTGALWCVWAIRGVAVIEPYTLPPAVAAITVATVMLARRGRGRELLASGLAVAVLPSLVALAALGSESDVAPWRTLGLLAGALLLLAAAAFLGTDTGERMRRLGVVRPLVFTAAVVAASAGAIQGVRWALGADPAPDWTTPVMVPVLAVAVIAALLAGLAAVGLAGSVGTAAAAGTDPTDASGDGRESVDSRSLGERSRWFGAPALVYLALGPIFATQRDWFSIWTLWALMAVLLVTAVVFAARDRLHRPVMPPFWFVYVIAWAAGVSGWSQRDLRVEVFSLPLGVAVLVAGVLCLRPRDGWREPRATFDSWPVGFRGSWRLLAPGIILTLLPSVLATATDPQLYRPIMVIALALVLILVGSARKLAAPFILGLLVLPIENIVVFAAQIDRTVGAMPWWITLATAGAVLLAIAVGAERKTTQGRGVAARLRELE
ncbi:SCO7613 C-terminal domain-containing membrane protein [Agromyces sp. NPDC058110]|uniref:SCO7613 C-terminal domain-containing membrane protein n=1 Tax=Agromyces sp. NPDC058110 TaxID=3346345 RepID=UPI0036DC4985